MNLKDKVIVITGASRGLGEALARAFASHQAKVVVSSRSTEDLKKLAEEIRAEAVTTDVTKESDVNHLVSRVIEKYGQIDVWINNAGIWMKHGPITELDTDKLRQVIDVNLIGTVHGSKVALIQMKRQHQGTIVNIISTSALEGRLGSSGYGASKFAADGFTKSLQLEAKESGVRAIAVYPGGTQTHLFDEQKPDGYDSYMKPSDVAEKIVANLELEAPEESLILKRPTA